MDFGKFCTVTFIALDFTTHSVNFGLNIDFRRLSKYNTFVMLKIETIWHHLLNEALEKGQTSYTQQDLARKFGYSISTIHHALVIPTELGAIKKSGKSFALADFQKLLYYWAGSRRLEKDIIFSCYVDKDVRQIESLVYPESVFACYSAYRMRYTEPAGDYSKVYIYSNDIDKQKIYRRMEVDLEDREKNPNFYILKKTAGMDDFGKITTLPQTFVDIWNLPDWYSGEFISQLKEKIRGISTALLS